MTPARYRRDVLAFIDEQLRRNELGQPWRLLPHQRAILREAFAFDEDGRLPWETILTRARRRAERRRSMPR